MKLWKKNHKEGGTTIHCMIGGRTYKSWWSGPLPSIDHAGLEYIKGRYPIITTKKRSEEFKKKYKMLFVTVTDEQLREMKYALGLNYKKKPYRNRFVTQDDDTGWNDLISKGLAAKNSENEFLYGNGNAFFWLTKEGVEFVIGKSINNKKYEEL